MADRPGGSGAFSAVRGRAHGHPGRARLRGSLRKRPHDAHPRGQALRPRRRGELQSPGRDHSPSGRRPRHRRGRRRRHAPRPLQHAGERDGQAARADDRRDPRQAVGPRRARPLLRRLLSPGLFRRAHPAWPDLEDLGQPASLPLAARARHFPGPRARQAGP